MRSTHFGTALRSIALLGLLSLGSSLSPAVAQAHHEYAQPTPQRYQHAPTGPEQLPSFAPAPAQQPEPASEPDSAQAPAAAQPAQSQSVAEDSLAATGNQLLAFLQQHMAATFLCILMLAPLWAMFGMRRNKHPYDH